MQLFANEKKSHKPPYYLALILKSTRKKVTLASLSIKINSDKKLHMPS